jgi:hypothetical protein
VTVPGDLWMWLVGGVFVYLIVTNVAQRWWVGRSANPDGGPRSRERWQRGPAAEVEVGDKVLSFHIGANPETVVAVDREGDAVHLRFRSGRSRRLPAATLVRRHAHRSGAPGT